jgi:hypothetical protein
VRYSARELNYRSGGSTVNREWLVLGPYLWRTYSCQEQCTSAHDRNNSTNDCKSSKVPLGIIIHSAVERNTFGHSSKSQIQELRDHKVNGDALAIY